MNLLSPGIEGRNVVSVARSDGIVDINYYVDYDSYGVSPVAAYSGGAWYVWLSGDVFGSDDVDLIDSYGFLAAHG